MFEVLWVTAAGYVAEATTSNLFLVIRGKVVTPPLWVGALGGVVREVILRLARQERFTAVEHPVTRHELYNAEEAWLTNSLVGMVPIRRVDGRRIGRACPGVVTRRLARRYAEYLRRSR